MGAAEGGTWPLPFLLQEASPGPHTICTPSPHTGVSPNAMAGRPTHGHCVHTQEYELRNLHVFAHTCHTWHVLDAHPGSRSHAVRKGPQSSCSHSACFPCCSGTSESCLTHGHHHLCEGQNTASFTLVFLLLLK